MIVLDTSALVAVLRGEAEAMEFASIIAESENVVIGAPTKFELAQVVGGAQRAEGVADMQMLLEHFSIEVIAWSDAHAGHAAAAFLRYGKGSGHPAKLNFGDCMAYAVAKSFDAPLLYKGRDFSLTDIKSAL